MTYTIKHAQLFLGKYVYVRLHSGAEYRGRLIEVQEKVLKLEPSTFIPFHLIEDIFWSPTEEEGYRKMEVIQYHEL